MPVCSAISSGRGLAAQLGDQLALGAADLVELLDHVHRDADRARLVGERAGDRLADPPGGVGRELEALAVVELLGRADQAERALLDQVEEGKALVAVVLRDRDDQAQVGLDHLLLGVEVAALDALGEIDLLLRREQPDLADVLQEQLKGVGGHVGLQVDRGLGLPPAAAVDRALDLGRGMGGIVLDELDLRLLEVSVQLLDVALVELHLGERSGDLREGQRSSLLALRDEELDLFKLLQFSYRHFFPCGKQDPALGRRAHLNRPDEHRARESEVKRWKAEIPLTSQSAKWVLPRTPQGDTHTPSSCILRRSRRGTWRLGPLLPVTLDCASMSDDKGVLGNLPRSRPGRRSTKRAGDTPETAAPPAGRLADAAAKAATRSEATGRPRRSRPARRRQSRGPRSAPSRLRPARRPGAEGEARARARSRRPRSGARGGRRPRDRGRACRREGRGHRRQDRHRSCSGNFAKAAAPLSAVCPATA